MLLGATIADNVTGVGIADDATIPAQLAGIGYYLNNIASNFGKLIGIK